MPERPRHEEPWPGGARRDIWLGLALPRRIRRRVFEPAYYDFLSAARATAGRTWHRRLGVVLLLLESLRVGLPSEVALGLHRRRRGIRRTGALALFGLALLFAALLLVRLYSPAY